MSSVSRTRRAPWLWRDVDTSQGWNLHRWRPPVSSATSSSFPPAPCWLHLDRNKLSDECRCIYLCWELHLSTSISLDIWFVSPALQGAEDRRKMEQSFFFFAALRGETLNKSAVLIFWCSRLGLVLILECVYVLLFPSACCCFDPSAYSHAVHCDCAPLEAGDEELLQSGDDRLAERLYCFFKWTRVLSFMY